MPTETIINNSTVSDPTGFCAFAEAKYGTNGDVSGATPEVAVGHDASDALTARRVWDANPSDGVDSGWVAATLVAEVGGGSAGVKWTVNGAGGTLTYTGVTYGNIGTVRVRACAQVRGQVRWRNAKIEWYRGTRRIEWTADRAAGPEVDTRTGTATEAEQIWQAVPTGTTHTRLVVSGEFSLACPEGVVPGPEDLFVQVLVDATSCTQV